MAQLHTRFSDEQVVFLLQKYSEGLMTRVEVQEVLGIGKTRFFALWREYIRNPGAFTVCYQRSSPIRISLEAEVAIERELLRERALIDNPELPISSYNYSALRCHLTPDNRQGIYTQSGHSIHAQNRPVIHAQSGPPTVAKLLQ